MLLKTDRKHRSETHGNTETRKLEKESVRDVKKAIETWHLMFPTVEDLEPFKFQNQTECNMVHFIPSLVLFYFNKT